jgi:hypothetical protein
MALIRTVMVKICFVPHLTVLEEARVEVLEEARVVVLEEARVEVLDVFLLMKYATGLTMTVMGRWMKTLHCHAGQILGSVRRE